VREQDPFYPEVVAEGQAPPSASVLRPRSLYLRPAVGKSVQRRVYPAILPVSHGPVPGKEAVRSFLQKVAVKEHTFAGIFLLSNSVFHLIVLERDKSYSCPSR